MDTNNSSDHQPIEAPSGLDLHPQPQKAVRISRRASMAIVSVIVLLLLAFAYGGYRRTLNNQTAARDAGLPKSVTPATQAGTEFMQATPAGTVPMTLRPPECTRRSPSDDDGSVRRRSEDGPAVPLQSTNRSALRRPSPGASRRAATERDANARPFTPTPVHEETPEERRLAAAYQREQEAIQAPTSIRNSATSSLSATRGHSARVE